MFGGQSQPDFSQWLACSPVTTYGDIGSNRDPSAPHWMAARPAKDPNWLTLEVCREFARAKCNRSDDECKFAHPPAHFDVQNGKVTCCFDSLHNRCQRVEPPCKYLHPPEHLREQLTAQNRGPRIGGGAMARVGTVGIGGAVGGGGGATMSQMMPTTMMPFMSPYMTPQNAGAFTAFAQMLGGGGGMIGGHAPYTGMMPPMAAYTPVRSAPRSDKIEICREYQRGTCSRDPGECRYAHPPEEIAPDADNRVTVCMDYIKGRCTRETCRYFHLPPHLQAQLKAASASQQHRTSPAHALSVPQSLTASLAALRLSSDMQPVYGATGNASNYHQMSTLGMAHGAPGGGSSTNYHQMSTLGSLQPQSVSLQAGQAMFSGHQTYGGLQHPRQLQSAPSDPSTQQF